MKIKPADDFEIPYGEPFKNDKLGREPAADALKDLLSNLDEPFVLAIDSQYGTGKTTFLEMFRKKLEKDSFRCISFNAWENDFIGDPLAALIGAITSQVEESSVKTIKGKFTKEVKNIKKAGEILLKRLIPFALKLASQGLLDPGKDYDKVFDALMGKLASKSINEYKKQKEEVDKFKDALSKFSTVTYKNENNEPIKKPVIVLIDELDRCRPNFALELLERIKHFFNIKGFVFVLAYDKNSMGSMISTIYGNDLDVDGYLRRFIDLESRLPEPKTDKYVNYLFDKFELDKFFKSRKSNIHTFDKSHLQKAFTELFKIYNTPLRKQEHCFIQLSILFHMTPSDRPLHAFAVALLIVIKNSDPKLYYRFVNEEIGHGEILDSIRTKTGGIVFLESDTGAIMEAYIVLCYEEDRVSEYRQKQDELSKSNDIPQDKPDRIEIIRKIITPNGYFYNSGLLNKIKPRLELLERFHDFTEEDENKQGG
ncbi:MAG: KAP family NTPase [Nitrospinota bacterium]|nr:KAP family NTPase [Nitrospinota bacterium]